MIDSSTVFPSTWFPKLRSAEILAVKKMLIGALKYK